MDNGNNDNFDGNHDISTNHDLDRPDTAEPDNLKVLLTHWEGRQLSQFLDPLIGQSDDQIDTASLRAVQEKLDDANALALWLRESVNLSLTARELTSVVEALKTELDDCSTPPDENHAILASIAEKFCHAGGLLARH